MVVLVLEGVLCRSCVGWQGFAFSVSSLFSLFSVSFLFCFVSAAAAAAAAGACRKCDCRRLSLLLCCDRLFFCGSLM